MGQVLCMFPLNQASVAAVGPELAGEAAGLYNMGRNLGGSIGLASLGAVIDRREALHVDAVRETVSANSPLVQERLAGMAQSFTTGHGDAAYGQLQALRQLAAGIGRQAMVMTFSDAFWGLAMLLILCLPLVFLVKSPRTGAAVMGH